ncbi:MAG: SPFH domain-containing protein [Oscillospiraceae bacterium]|nr:SPFH domain-containing protein [Oscillospiraceae bacterium]
MNQKEKIIVVEEIDAKGMAGMPVLILSVALYLGAIAGLVFGIIWVNVPLIVLTSIWLLIGWIPFLGLKILRPNEAFVLTLFGKYYGTLRGPGFYFVNPFTSPINPAGSKEEVSGAEIVVAGTKVSAGEMFPNKRISLKTLTLNNERQKINDKLGNPIEIGIVVIWRVVNTARAVFNVDNYAEFLSIQCDSALRNIVRLYPYDVADDSNLGEKSLRGSSIEIAESLQQEIQAKVQDAGLEIIEAKITSLAYAPEIAAAMLQRQQASAIVDAKHLIVEAAVGMVESALTKLSENQIVHLDEERKATMASNLLVVLCSSRDTQPVVNSGSLY